MDSGDVEQAVAESLRALRPLVDADWQRPAGSLEWTCRETAAHIAHDLLAYAAQLTGPGTRPAYLPLDLVIRPAASADEALDALAAAGGLLSAALRCAPPDLRRWHWGPTDVTGFAALGVNETLIHTYDIRAGLGVPFAPDPALCAGVLRRLFPDAPPGDPVAVQRWCTGRVALPGHPRQASWRMHAALT